MDGWMEGGRERWLDGWMDQGRWEGWGEPEGEREREGGREREREGGKEGGREGAHVLETLLSEGWGGCGGREEAALLPILGGRGDSADSVLPYSGKNIIYTTFQSFIRIVLQPANPQELPSVGSLRILNARVEIPSKNCPIGPKESCFQLGAEGPRGTRGTHVRIPTKKDTPEIVLVLQEDYEYPGYRPRC
eukprot:3864418-Rhodomonas_salina.1